MYSRICRGEGTLRLKGQPRYNILASRMPRVKDRERLAGETGLPGARAMTDAYFVLWGNAPMG